MTTQQDIDNFDDTSSTEELLRLAALTKSETSNRILSVATVDDLPDLTNNSVTPGTVFYVESIRIPVVAQVGCWTGLDNRELRSDCLLSFALSWGYNTVGQLGNGVVTPCINTSPVSVVGGFTDWCQVSAGNVHSLALRTDGTAWAWGCNSSGQLGDCTTNNRSSPVSVVGGFTDWCQVSASGSHSLALRTTGTAWAWGPNGQGRLGDGTTTDRSSPVSVVGGFTDWCQVSAGSSHSLALRTNGTAWGWGYNGSGRLGDGTTTSRLSPVSVVGGFTDWCQVSAGAHSLGVRCDGTAWAWGPNGQGRLGDGTTTDRSSPVSVVGGFTDWCQISAGDSQSLALRTNGTAWAWGLNYCGRSGDGTTTNRSSPVSVVGGFTDWCQISAGSHSIALRTNGTAWSWGNNSRGQLGDTTTTNRSSPVSVVGGFTDWFQVSAGTGRTSSALRRC
jgi:alpha-tubulin suppressor-like RCC1 family protein